MNPKIQRGVRGLELHKRVHLASFLVKGPYLYMDG